MKSKINLSILMMLFAITSTLGFTSCGASDSDYDASGAFETDEVVVSAEAMGKIMQLNIQEGQKLQANQVVGYIDSTQLHLKKLQLEASIKALQSRRPNIRKQIAALEQQVTSAKVEQNRVNNLVQANAATTKQQDDVNTQVAVLEKQLAALKSTLETTNEGISNDYAALTIQKEQIEDQLNKCKITSPIKGTVIVKYAFQGELAGIGRALFKIGDLDNITLRAYVTADQLSEIKLGQKVKVYADFGKDGTKSYDGIIRWISDKSEFTPKTIQTRDERANLVYAVKISVKNDGYLKIGQYGGVKFNISK